jgi:hypothetical protein
MRIGCCLSVAAKHALAFLATARPWACDGLTDQSRPLSASQRITAGPTEHNIRPAMKIGKFRGAVGSLNWYSHDLFGATRHEFVAMDVRARIERHIVTVTGLLSRVYARFADDLTQTRSAIESALARAAVASIVGAARRGWRGRSIREDSRLVAHSLHSGRPGARHPFGTGLNPARQTQRVALGLHPALCWLKCAALRR